VKTAPWRNRWLGRDQDLMVLVIAALFVIGVVLYYGRGAVLADDRPDAEETQTFR